jgi:hypothetical protein
VSAGVVSACILFAIELRHLIEDYGQIAMRDSTIACSPWTPSAAPSCAQRVPRIRLARGAPGRAKTF